MSTLPTGLSQAARDMAIIARATGVGRFIEDLQWQLRTKGTLSERQLATGSRAVEEYQHVQYLKATNSAPQAAQAASGDIVPALANGTYTVVLSSLSPALDRVTLRIKDANFGDLKGTGKQLVGYLSGSDNETDFTNFAFLTGSSLQVWARFKGQLARQQAAVAVLLGTADATVYGLAYALMSSRCWRCNRTLTVPASIHNGLGPDCAGKVDVGPLEGRLQAAHAVLGTIGTGKLAAGVMPVAGRTRTYAEAFGEDVDERTNEGIEWAHTHLDFDDDDDDDDREPASDPGYYADVSDMQDDHPGYAF